MATFRYKAAKANGLLETGIMEASSEDSLVSTLQQKGLIILSITKGDRALSRQEKNRSIKMHSRISAKDLILFTTQLATTLKASIPLLKCLDIQITQTTSSKFKIVLENIRDNIRQGHTLKDSLAKYPKLFNSLWLNLVEAGEASGQLPATLEMLGQYLTDQADLKRKAITALIYPSLLISVSILAIYIFMVKVIPIFTGVFRDFKMTLPLITRIVVAVSDFLKSHVLSTIALVFVVGFSMYYYYKTEKGRKVCDGLSFKIPIFGSFILNSALEKFSGCLGILIHSGIPILQAIDIVARTSGNKVMEEALTNAYIDVRDGKSLSSSLEKNALFPPLTVSMCNVGEETGELDKMLEHINKYYKDELTTFVERLSATLEPVVIVFMGGIVFVLVLAMYLPIFELALLGKGG